MISRQTLKAIAIALPLSLGVAAPAMADNYRSDRYYDDRSYDDGYYDRNYDRERYRRDYDDYRRPDYDYDRERHGYRQFLSPRQISYSLRRRGYSRINRVSFSRRDGHYHAIANDTLGSTFRLSISAYSGRVIHRQYLYGPQYRRYDRDYYDRYY
jgi:hypothetical protein